MKLRSMMMFCSALLVACSARQEPAALNTVQPPPVVHEVVGIGRVEPATRVVSLATHVGGIVREVLAHDGQVVHAGDVLLRIDDESERLALALAQQRVKTQFAQISADEASLAEAMARRANKQRTLTASEALAGTGSETRQNVDDVATEVRTLDATIARTTALLSASRQKLAELRLEVQTAEHDVALRCMRAPNDGTILELPITVGSAIAQYGTYAQFAPTSSIVVRCEVDELFANRVIVGRPVAIRAIGSSTTITTGTVTSVSPALRKKSLFSEKTNEQEDRRVREVVIGIPNAASLLINAKVECIISL